MFQPLTKILFHLENKEVESSRIICSADDSDAIAELGHVVVVWTKIEF